MTRRPGHLQCPFCETYAVDRLFLASARVDSCACATCGARWEEDPETGEYLGRADRNSVLTSSYRPRNDAGGGR